MSTFDVVFCGGTINSVQPWTCSWNGTCFRFFYHIAYFLQLELQMSFCIVLFRCFIQFFSPLFRFCCFVWFILFLFLCFHTRINEKIQIITRNSDLKICCIFLLIMHLKNNEQNIFRYQTSSLLKFWFWFLRKRHQRTITFSILFIKLQLKFLLHYFFTDQMYNLA